MKFIAYLTADTNSVEMALALVKGGVDLLEIGIPFSDPLADGPVIQEAAARAISNGITPYKVLDIVREIRKHSAVKIILFTYFNPVLKAGKEYLKEAKKAGVDGILVVDLPYEYSQEIDAVGLDKVQIISPSTPEERMKEICKHSSGFIYYACRKGTTGVRETLPEDLERQLARIRNYTALPISVGFGIGTKEQAADVLKVADAFVIGSLFVKAVLEGTSPEQLTQLALSVNPGV